MLNCTELPLHQTLIYWPCPTASGAVSQSYLRCCSQAALLILPQIKVNSTLSSCVSFLAQSYDDRGSSPEWTSFLLLNATRSQSFVPAAATCTIHLLWECRWVQVSLSWLSNLPYWLRVWLIWKWRRLPAPSQVERYWGWGGQVKYQGQTHSWSRHWVGLS